jgi:hypothetical protein
VFQIGVVPSRIDILTAISGVAFADAWPRRTVLTIEGRPLAFLGREDLERNKHAAGRARSVARRGARAATAVHRTFANGDHAAAHGDGCPQLLAPRHLRPGALPGGLTL